MKTTINVEWTIERPDTLIINHYSPEMGWSCYHLVFQPGTLRTARRRNWRQEEVLAAYERGRIASVIRWCNQQDKPVHVERMARRVAA